MASQHGRPAEDRAFEAVEIAAAGALGVAAETTDATAVTD
jgi:hypothetical protein